MLGGVVGSVVGSVVGAVVCAVVCDVVCVVVGVVVGAVVGVVIGVVIDVVIGCVDGLAVVVAPFFLVTMQPNKSYFCIQMRKTLPAHGASDSHCREDGSKMELPGHAFHKIIIINK